jgi:hypothetical protein
VRVGESVNEFVVVPVEFWAHFVDTDIGLGEERRRRGGEEEEMRGRERMGG